MLLRRMKRRAEVRSCVSKADELMNYASHSLACAFGIAIGGAALYGFDGSGLAREQAFHVRDNETSTPNPASFS